MCRIAIVVTPWSRGLVQTRQQQSLDDHDQIDLESVLQIMAEAAEVKIEV